MLELPVADRCRLSGEPLADVPVLLELADCPLPGIYPDEIRESLALRSPLRVVRAPGSGLVQLAHRFDPSLYADYGFAGDTSDAYRAHLEWFAGELHAGAGPDGAVLEVGCGDGTLLELLRALGHQDVIGIDPGRAAGAQAGARGVIHGFFPDDLPPRPASARYRAGGAPARARAHRDAARVRGRARRVPGPGRGAVDRGARPRRDTRHADGGATSTSCTATTSTPIRSTRLAATAGLRCIGGTLVDVFGGSLLRRYRHGSSRRRPARDGAARAAEGFAVFQDRLAELAANLPANSAGYGAAERTALTLGACPALAARLSALHDGNRLLHGRHLAGTALRIRSPEELYEAAPDAVVLFAVSHRDEILREWRCRLRPGTLVAVADGECSLAALGSLGG